MNERIKELADKCWEEDGIGPAYFNPEKFAELIVRECANVAAKNQAEDMGWDISEIIKEHFGVEE